MVRQSTVLATKSRRSPIRSSVGTARYIASTSVSFCTLDQAREVGPGQPSYRISANLKYTISDPCMEDRVRVHHPAWWLPERPKRYALSTHTRDIPGFHFP